MISQNRSTVSIALTLTNIMMYLFYSINPAAFTALFVLDTNSIFSDFIPWQLVTYVFFFPENIVFFFFTLLIYLIIGLGLERTWGSVRFALFIVTIILSKSIPALLLGTPKFSPLLGDMTMNLCFIIAYGFTHPDQEFRLYFFIPIKVKTLAIISLCAIPFFIFYPFYRYPFLPTGGYISLPLNMAFAIVSALSFISILVFYRLIFFQKKSSVVVKIKENMKIRADELQRTSKIEKNRKYTRILNEYSKHGKADLAGLAHLDTQQVSLCSQEDFEKNDLYCLGCEKYPSCVKREIDRKTPGGDI